MGETTPTGELFGALLSLYHSREYADLALVARDGSRHLVHCALVCPRSKFFREQIKNGHWQEQSECEIALDDEEPDVVGLLVDYLYLLNYEPIVNRGQEVGDNTASSVDDDNGEGFSHQSEYGHVYGTSAISAFGGPGAFPSYPPTIRSATTSSLTIHALPGAPTHPEFQQMHHQMSPLSSRGVDPGSRRKGSRSTIPTMPPISSPPDPSPLASKEPNLMLHARMFAAGQKFGIGGLRSLALDKFKIQLTRHWDSPEFAEAIHIVFTSTPASEKDMREMVANTLDWRPSLLDKPEIEFAIMEINGLAYELLKRSRRAEAEYM